MTELSVREPLLDVRNMSISVAGRAGETTVVHDVSFTLAHNETLGVVGESGCGKSISMLGLVGLLPHGAKITAGTAKLNGEDLLKASDARLREIRGDKVSFVFQDPMTAFNPVVKIGEQISEVLVYKKGMSKSDARRRVGDLFELVGIPGARRRIDDYPHQLSGGMRQRAMIAMALAGDPDILIADEPTTALDVTIQSQIVDLIKDIKRETEMAVVWITHDLALVSGVVDKISVFYSGRVVEQAPVDDLFARPTHPYTKGLLASLPTLDGPRGGKLRSIGGSPPDPTKMPPGCAFAPRCDRASASCLEGVPKLASLAVPENHLVACINASSEAEGA